jgi:hypothetical protein
MTLVLVAANSEQTVMLADRRLTSNGQVAEEDAGKLCTYTIGGARFAVGFVGLARAGSFDTRQWLLDALYDSVEPGRIKSLPTLHRFRERASRDFAQLPALRSLGPAEKRAEFMFVGFVNAPEHSVLAAFLVSNFRDADKQSSTSWSEFALSGNRECRPRTAEPAIVFWSGAATAITAQDAQALCSLLVQRKPPQAIIGKATEIMIDGARRPEATGTVGTRIVWARIPADRRLAVETHYYSAEPCFDTYMPDRIVCTPGGSAGLAGVKIEAVDRNKPPAGAIPRVHRHAPCPCKSGRRYKNCHGAPPRRARIKR